MRQKIFIMAAPKGFNQADISLNIYKIDLKPSMEYRMIGSIKAWAVIFMCRYIFDLIAQLVERCAVNAKVIGSSPVEVFHLR